MITNPLFTLVRKVLVQARSILPGTDGTELGTGSSITCLFTAKNACMIETGVIAVSDHS